MAIIYIVYENETDLCFFEGEAADKEQALEIAANEYFEKYPGDKGKEVGFYVQEIDTDDE